MTMNLNVEIFYDNLLVCLVSPGIVLINKLCHYIFVINFLIQEKQDFLKFGTNYFFFNDLSKQNIQITEIIISHKN